MLRAAAGADKCRSPVTSCPSGMRPHRPARRARQGRDAGAGSERPGMPGAAPSTEAHALTEAQVQARERWQRVWGGPIFFAAVVPLFVTSPKTQWVALVVGLGSWLVFVVDLVVQRRI